MHQVGLRLTARQKSSATFGLSVFEIALNEQFPQSNNARRGDDQLLFLWGKIEGFDVNESRVCGGDGSQVRGDVNGIESLLIGGRLLADIPFQRRKRQVLAAFFDRGLQPFGRSLR